MGERLCSIYSLSRVEDQHLFEEVEGDWVLCLEPLAEQNAFALGGTLYEAECQEVRVGLTQRPIFGCKPDDVITRSAQKFSDDRE